MTGPDEITGANFRAYRHGEGIVRCDHPDRADVNDQDARAALDAILALAGPGPTPVLVDLRRIRSVSREARKVFTASRVPSRIALYVESSLSRTIANFFIGVAKPDVPTRVFTDLGDAEGWLLDDG